MPRHLPTNTRLVRAQAEGKDMKPGLNPHNIEGILDAHRILNRHCLTAMKDTGQNRDRALSILWSRCLEPDQTQLRRACIIAALCRGLDQATEPTTPTVATSVVFTKIVETSAAT